MNKTALLLGVTFCGLSVVLGAFGAHGLKDKLSDYSISVFNKGVMYQFFHGIGIILTVILDYNLKSLSFDTSIWLFTFGIILFSGSLYILAITEIKWLGMITPIGGVMFILGWITMFINVLRLK